MSTITTTLSCGMPLIVETIPGVRSASVCWLLPVGSAADAADRQGASTMLSELVFRGAGALSSREQADALDRLGLSRGSDVGGFFMRLTATMLGDKVIDALPLLVDIVRRPRIEADAVAPARELALQALAGLKDQPQERGAVVLTARHNPPPLNRSGMGTEEGLSAVSREELIMQWERCARPVGSILAVAGAVDPAAIARRLEELLKGWSGAAPEVKWSAAATRGTYHHEPEQSSQVHIYLAHEGPKEADREAVLERVVASVLSGGSAARLFSEVREKRGLCYSVSASYASDKHWGRVTGYVGTTPDKAQQSLDVLTSELKRITTEEGAVTADEFQRAMVGYKTRLVFSGESTNARAGALASDQHRIGRPRSLEEVAAEVGRVTLADVNGYLARRKMGPVTIVTLGPTGLKTMQ